MGVTRPLDTNTAPIVSSDAIFTPIFCPFTTQLQSLSLLHLSPVEQAVVYSTSTTGLSTLTFRGGVVASGGGVEERGEVIYWHRTNTVIYYMYHNSHSCIA